MNDIEVVSGEADDHMCNGIRRLALPHPVRQGAQQA